MFLNKWKHIFLLFLLTGIALFVTKSFWYFPSNGIEVSFTSQAEKPIAYQVFYTTSDKRSFNVDEKVVQTVRAGKQPVRINLPTRKIVNFRLDLGEFPQKLTISDLIISGDNAVSLDKLSDFTLYQINGSYQKGKFFRFNSKEENPYIVYKSDLNLHASSGHIDYYILFIIAVISLLAGHKIVKYLAQFKFKESSSRIDIVFVTVFFVLLFVPMLKISGADKSEKENRMLAKYVPFIKDGQINLKYSTNFESWYNDRFFGRDVLINIWSFLEQKISRSRGNKNGLIGKDGWLFATSFNSIDMYRHDNLFSKKELEAIGHNLTHFVKEAKTRGVKEVYFYLSNDKESLYGEYYPSWIKQLDQPSRLEQLYAFIKLNYPELKIFNFADELRDIKKQGEVLFFKAGTHMNSVGAFYEYHFLMQEISKDFPNLIPLTLSDFKITEEKTDDKDIYKALNLSNKTYNSENFKNKKLNFINKTHIKWQEERFHKTYRRLICHNDKVQNSYKLLTINDSFLIYYRDFLGRTFQDVELNFWTSGKPFVVPNDACHYWPMKNDADILLVTSTERFLDRFLTLKYPCSNR